MQTLKNIAVTIWQLVIPANPLRLEQTVMREMERRKVCPYHHGEGDRCNFCGERL